MNSNEEEERLLCHKVPINYESMPKESNEIVDDAQSEYTFEEAIEYFGFGRFQIRLIFSVGMVVLSNAAQILAPAVLGTVIECNSWKISKINVAWLTTVVFLGMFTCSPVVGWIIDKFGRKKGLLLILTCTPIFASLGSLSPNYPCLVASRFFVGAGLAGSLQGCGYIEEFLPASHRRRALLTQLFWPVGGLWASGIGLLVIYKYNLSWNWYLLVLSAPLFVTVLAFILLPESVRFLEALGKFDKVDKILAKIGKENKTGLPEGSLSRVNLRGSNANETELPKAKFKDLFSGGNFKTTLPVGVMWFASGFSYYGIIILIPLLNTKKVADVPNCVPLKLSDYGDLMWTGFAELPGTILVFFVLELIGRKKTLVIQFIVTGCTLVPFLFGVPRAASFFAILIARAVCQGTISSLVIYTPEVYPTFLRGKGMGVTSMFFHIGCMTTPFFSQVTVEHYFRLTIGVYISCCFVAAICAIISPKETRGLQLED